MTKAATDAIDESILASQPFAAKHGISAALLASSLGIAARRGIAFSHTLLSCCLQPNLTWLDLSFNSIFKIEGLDTLTKLTDLSLYHNQIATVENLDALTNLQVLSLGKNNIATLDNIVYMRRFFGLHLVNLEGNPVCKDEFYRSYVLSHIKHLVYFDYRYFFRKNPTAASHRNPAAASTQRRPSYVWRARVSGASASRAVMVDCA